MQRKFLKPQVYEYIILKGLVDKLTDLEMVFMYRPFNSLKAGTHGVFRPSKPCRFKIQMAEAI